MFKLNAARRLLAAEDIIAPAESFQKENKRDLDRQQQQREREQTKKTREPDTKTKPAGDTTKPAGGTTTGASLILKAAFRLVATATYDNDFPAGHANPERYITNDPKTTDYLNVTASDEEVLSDADPKLFNIAEQPLG